MTKIVVEPSNHSAKMVYEIKEPAGGWRIGTAEYSDEYKQKLRPIAETLALLDGNNISGPVLHYTGYLIEADAVYRNNGGENGWASKTGWIQDLNIIQKDPTLRDVYDKLQILIALKRNENGNT